MLCYITLCVVFVGFAFGQDEITTAPPPIVYLTDATPGQEQITTAPPPIEFVTEGSSAPEKPIKYNTQNFREPYVFKYQDASQCGNDGAGNLQICIGRSSEFCYLNNLAQGRAAGTFDGDWYFNNCLDVWHRLCCGAIVQQGNGDWNEAAKQQMHFYQYVIKGYEIPTAWNRSAALREAAMRFA